MKCIIVEDEVMAVKVLESHISHFPDLEVVGVYNNAMAVFGALQAQAIDILFLDIQLPKMTGLQLLKTLKHQPAVIMTTAHREYALEGYELDVVDYLLKPISLDRFAKAIGKVYSQQQTTQSSPLPALSIPNTQHFSAPFIYVKVDREFVKILLDEILYIESIKNHIKIVGTSNTWITLLSLGQIEEKLPEQRFLRIHRSFIISIHKITRFSKTNVTIGEQLLPVGRHYQKAFQERLEKDIL